MHIKRITIQGFKTYKNETIITNLSPHYNVITGRNGSGKSNFFAAIRFVLSDDFARLSNEERKSLLHESSTPTLFAYVEIVFDNTDRRIPTPKDEVKVKRSIGFKKDDYSLNDQSMTRSEIMSHLSVAGFSKSNPYYIVPQGRVTALTNAKDSERLQLLKDVAGAGVFETKLKESQKEMNVTAQKQEQIRSMLEDIDQRLGDLNIEREEYKQFDILNRERKMIEWTIRDREIKSLQDQIDKINVDEEDDEEKSVVANQVQRRERIISDKQKVLASKLDEKKLALIEVDQLEKQKAQLSVSLANLKVSLSSLEVESNTNYDEIKSQLNDVTAQIKGKEAELEELSLQIDALNTKLREKSIQINNLTDTQMKLINKKTQNSRFENQKERDNWLNVQIEKLTQSKVLKKSQVEKTEIELNDTIKQIKDLEVTQMEQPSTEIIDQQIKEIDIEYMDLKSQSRSLVDERSQFWRDESRKNAIINQYQDTMLKLEQDLHNVIDGSISKGIDLVNSIAEKFGQKDKVYGCLGELITISEKYRTAAEVIAGNSLFNIVVANEQVAQLIIKELTKYKGARITFIPLNKIQDSDYTYPQGNLFVPLYKKISPIGDEATKKALWPAVKHVFGKALVCINLDIAGEIVREYHLDAITLDGDRVDSNGVLSGGYRSDKASKVKFLSELTTIKSQISTTKDEIEFLKENVKKLDVLITQKNNAMNLKRSNLEDLVKQRNLILEDSSKLKLEFTRLNNQKLLNEKLIEDLNNQMAIVTQRIEDYRSQKNSRFSQSTLSGEEYDEFKNIIETLPKVEREKLQIQQQLDQLELEKSNINSLLNEKLNLSFNDLSSKLIKFDHDISAFQKDDIESQITSLKSKEQSIESQMSKYLSQISDVEHEMNSIESEIDELDTEQAEAIELYDELNREADKGMVKKTRLRNIQKEKEKIIGELGALPENTKLAYQEESTSSLTSKMIQVNQDLKAFNHVNKKALDQYKRFYEQKVGLVHRLEELEESKESIEHLMKVLEKRKNEAIIRSFKDVSIGFSKVFEKLVPDGKGKLIILKKKNIEPGNSFSLSQVQPALEESDDDDEVGGEEHHEEEHSDLEMKSFIGVSISVSFNSKQDEQQRIEQLSGGQKTLCALALIFAIQNSDPAPFYLFDEIDANLDTQYRTAVANLVHNLSRKAQFICTTFRPEQLKVCDKFYGVLFNNKTSTISEIDQDTALGFIENS